MVKRAIGCLVAMLCVAVWAEDPEPESEGGCVPLVPEFDENIHVYDGCWEVETWSPPTVVPLFEWEEIYEAAKFELDGGVEPAWKSDCLAGSGSTLPFTFTAPSYTVTKGKIGWKTDATECILDGKKEEEIDLDVTWKWQAPAGASQTEGTGETATFDFGAASPGCYDVVFTATGTPSWEGCPEVTESVTGRISAVSVELTVPEQVNTCCTPETKSAFVTVHTGCDDVEVDGVEWSATPEGRLTFAPNANFPDDPTMVDVGNIKWYPGLVSDPCDRTCEYEITANVQFSNGESCSVTKSFTVEATKHEGAKCQVTLDYVGNPSVRTIMGDSVHCPYRAVLEVGTFRHVCITLPNPILMGDIPETCYFHPIIKAEEEYHCAQCTNSEASPPSGRDPESLIQAYNQYMRSNNRDCGSTPQEARNTIMIGFREKIWELLEETNKVPHPTRCSMEREAKAAAEQLGSLYFYSYDCTYAESGCP